MNIGKQSDLVVLCDFDGTITPTDVLGVLYDKFAGPECQELVQMWRQGEISAPTEVRGCFASMSATRAELESALDGIHLDAGFTDFLQLCQDRGVLFAVLSDGLYWYIHYILQRHSLSDITIFANEIEFTTEGPIVHSPWYSADTPLRGTSKPMIIRKYQADGYKVVFVGDGPTDKEAAEVADFIFAKGRLVKYCQEKGLAFTAFESFSDLIREWQLTE